jgi:RNA polymerase sigma-70 factor, ECF subfamily
MAAIDVSANDAPTVTPSPDQRGTQELLNVIARWKPSFYGIALRRLRNPADAEDAVQDALLSAFKHLGEFQGKAKMSTWVTRIVINATRMQARRVSRRSHIPLDSSDEQHEEHLAAEVLWDRRPTPEQLLQQQELENRLAIVSAQLPAYLRRTFHMRVAGLSIRETARILGMPEGTVKAHFSRARTRLRLLFRKNLRRGLPPNADKATHLHWAGPHTR